MSSFFALSSNSLLVIGTTPTFSQTIPPAILESIASSSKSILHAKHIAATETTVSPAPETSITFDVVDFFIFEPLLVFKKIPLFDRVNKIAFAEIIFLNFDVASSISVSYTHLTLPTKRIV